MSAHVTPVGASKYRGWCDKCKNGVNVTSPVAAVWWADDHNRRYHDEAA